MNGEWCGISEQDGREEKGRQAGPLEGGSQPHKGVSVVGGGRGDEGGIRVPGRGKAQFIEIKEICVVHCRGWGRSGCQ